MGHKFALIAGTRPEILKIYPLIVELEERQIEYIFICTGQQRDLVAQTLDNLNITPHINLDLMEKNQTPQKFLTTALHKLTEIFLDVKPTIVVVQGDTTSALAGALSGFFAKIPVGHVEAGLRSHDIMSPWPEEGFRRVIDAISSTLWYPTTDSIRPHEKDQVGVVTGNTIVDMLRLRSKINDLHNYSRNRILITLHRRESFEKTLEKALQEIKRLSQMRKYEIVFIEHPNPNIRQAIEIIDFDNSLIKIIQPLPYLEFVELMKSSAVIVTDSGGLQEEARSLNIPLLVLRDNSERMEAIDGITFCMTHPSGINLEEDIERVISRDRRTDFITPENPFGDGFSAARIIESITNREANGDEIEF